MVLAYVLVPSIFATDTVVLPTATDLLVADQPITYGDEAFRARILERTKGERDPIGLVLTGGSARAFAHLGVLQYMEEHGIEPDFIVSNSMGSIIGMLYSAGLSVNQIMEVVTSGELSSYFNLTVPLKGGLLDPSGFEGLVSSVVGVDTQIEDLPIPVMVVCQDLVTKREIRITEGDFTKVLLSSFALPVYFPPQEYRGHLLIDGGVVSLLPLEVAYDYSDTIIASTTFYDVDTINLRNVITILNGAFDVGKRQKAATELSKHKDLIWIRCGVEQFSFMDFAAAAEMAEIGYRSTLAEAEKLSGLYKGGMSPAIKERRAIMQPRIDRAKSNMYFFERIEQPGSSQVLSLGVHSFQDARYPYYLRDTFDLGLEYSWKFRKVELSLLVGGAFDTLCNEDQHSNMAFSANFLYYPISRLRFSLYGTATLGIGETDWYWPTLYGRQGLDFKFFSKRDWYSIELNEAFESYNSEGTRNDQNLLTVQTQGNFMLPVMNISAKAGYQMTFGPMTEKIRSFLFFEASTRLSPSWMHGLFLDLGIFNRTAIDGRNGVILYKADGFYTNDQTMYRMGRFGESVDDNLQKGIFILPLSLGYALPTDPTFAELMILSNFEIAAFCDLLFYDGWKPAYSVGVEVQGALSLIGLQQLPLTLRCGYDSLSDAVIFTLKFSIKR